MTLSDWTGSIFILPTLNLPLDLMPYNKMSSQIAVAQFTTAHQTRSSHHLFSRKIWYDIQANERHSRRESQR